jgi:hypothetical protein
MGPLARTHPNGSATGLGASRRDRGGTADQRATHQIGRSAAQPCTCGGGRTQAARPAVRISGGATLEEFRANYQAFINIPVVEIPESFRF